jgi:hypothetical protein
LKQKLPDVPALPVGTFVTVVYKDHCLCTRVAANFDGGHFAVVTDGQPLGPLYLDGEGIDWVRGHYVPSSKEAEACLVAQALREPAAARGGIRDADGNLLLRGPARLATIGPHPTRIYKKTP